MGLWVRSQSKTGLYKIDNVYIHEDEDKTIHIWTDGINKYLKYYLGGYKSKERALEVLDEIQKLMEPHIIYNNDKEHIENLYIPYRVYQMPEE